MAVVKYQHWTETVNIYLCIVVSGLGQRWKFLWQQADCDNKRCDVKWVWL